MARDRDWGEVGFAIAIVLCFILLVGVVAMFLYTSSPWGCEGRWPGRETRWELVNGCFVSVDGEWVLERNLRILE